VRPSRLWAILTLAAAVRILLFLVAPSWRIGAALLVPFLLLVGGWMARNGVITGVPVLSTIEGVNLLEYRAAGAIAEEEDVSLDQARARLRDQLERAGPGTGPAERNRAQRRLAFDVLREADPESIQGTGKRIASVLLAAPLGVLYLGALGGIVVLVRAGKRRELGLLAALIAYFVLLPAGPEANTRFRVPAVPFLTLLSGLGWANGL
jgi:hypothetical protein